jgi:hypothetical protein
MYVKEADVHDALMRVSDLISAEQDPLIRLAYAVKAMNEAEAILRRARDSAAYDARTIYGTAEIEQAVGLNHGIVAYWVRRHMDVTGLPRPKTVYRRREELLSAVDLSVLPSNLRATPTRSRS